MIKKGLIKRSLGVLMAAMLLTSSLTACDKGGDKEPTEASSEAKETEAKSTEAGTEEEKTTEAVTDAPTEAPTEEPSKEPTAEEVAEREAFDAYLNQLMLSMVEGSYYSIASLMENPENFGITVDDTLDYSLAGFSTDKAEVQEAIDANQKNWDDLKAFDFDLLDEERQLTYDKLNYEFDIMSRSYAQEWYLSPLDSMDGILSGVGIAMYNFPFDNEDDVKGYQKMLETIPQMLQDLPGYVQYQIDTYGYEPNDMMISSAISYSAALRELENNPLLAAYDEKIDEMDLADDVKQTYKDANYKYVVETLMPALEAFEAEIIKFDTDTNTTNGLCSYEGGAEYYDVLIESVIGKDMSAEEMYNKMMDRLAEDLELYFEYYESSALAYVAYSSGTYKLPYDKGSIDEICEYFTEAMATDFPTDMLPEYVIKYLPPALQIDGLGAFYYTGELDDSTAKQIRVNPKVTGVDAGLALDITLVHEGIAGHMLQAACCKDNHPVTQLFTELGYSEGWAMYAEIQSIQYMELSKAISTWMACDEMYSYYLIACMDLGINGMNWTMDDTVDYLASFGIEDEAAVQELWDTVVSSPAAYLPYALGYILTDELMEKYQAAAGEDVDLSEMHKKYMSIGDAGFDVVEKYFLKGLDVK